MALAIALAFVPNEDTDKKDKIILNLVYQLLNSSHFSPVSLNDDVSAKVFDDFIEALDYSKRFLLQSDINKLEKYRYQIDDQIKGADLSFFEDVYVVYQVRMAEAESYYEEILKKPFNYAVDESFEIDDENTPSPLTKEELKDRWRKYLKYRTLVTLDEKLTDQEDMKEDSDTAEVKTFEELEIEAREKVLEFHEQWFSNLKDLDRIDWVAAYLNTFTNIYDPHTQYLAPQRKEDFEINMTGQLEGIGAQLQQKGDYITITKIITGSACWKQGELEVGDKITKVAQGDKPEEDPVDLVGMKVRKAVDYIRGPKGSEVILTVKKVDGTKKEISIIRDVVELEATFAKSAILGEGDNKVGYIKLPKFYVNFYDEGNRDCAEDVKAELEKLKEGNVNGVILDLRGNGGGSLQGVIDIVGLFIEQGPVVQVKAPNRKPKVLSDEDGGAIAYDGPLVVMVDRYSASASEIFAAAIQDYGRGIIIGGKSTFGKGTVQNVVDMDRAVSFSYNDVKPLGALKVTIQKYYRIDGGTPQLRGVTPDIIMPDNYMHIPFGEKEQEYAMPYDEISSANYELWATKVDLKKIEKASEKRMNENEKFGLIEEYADWIKEERENTLISLNFETFRQKEIEYREESKRYKNMRKSLYEIGVFSNEADFELINSNEEEQKKTEQWHKSLRKDLYLQEALAVTLEASEYYN